MSQNWYQASKQILEKTMSENNCFSPKNGSHYEMYLNWVLLQESQFSYWYFFYHIRSAEGCRTSDCILMVAVTSFENARTTEWPFGGFFVLIAQNVETFIPSCFHILKILITRKYRNASFSSNRSFYCNCPPFDWTCSSWPPKLHFAACICSCTMKPKKSPSGVRME